MNRTLLAILVCLVIFIAYACAGAVLGWKHGGGMIPVLVLVAALSAAWKGIRSRGSVTADSNQADDEPPTPKQDE